MSKFPCPWPPVELGDIIDIFDSIRVPLNSRQRAERQGKYPYYGASGIIDSVDDYLFDGEYVLVAEDGENLNSRKLPVAFMARGQFWVNNHAHIIKGKKDIADDRFLIAWFAQADIKGYITGAAQPKLSQSNLKRVSLSVPPYPIQCKIAGVLSAYDDLIENNTRRLAILEEMAQAIYREWFVHFRFPEHENVTLIDSPLGKIPAGWGKHLGDVVTLKRGYDLPQRDRRPGNFPLVSSSGITDFHDAAMAKGPGVVTGRYGTLGEVFYIRKDFWPLNTTLYVRDFHENEPLLIVHLLRSLNLASQNAAGAVPGVNRNALHMLDISFPPSELQRLIAPVFEAIENSCNNLRSKNVNLRTTRDLLLPKLITGQLDVEELDIETGEPLVEAVA